MTGADAGGTAAEKRKREAQKDQDVARTALILGLLQFNKAPLPQVRANAKGDRVVPNDDHPNAAKFEEALFAAIGRIAGRMELAKRVLKLLGKGNAPQKLTIQVDAASESAKKAVEAAGGKLELPAPRA